MDSAKIRVKSWDIGGYGKVPKGALRDTIKMTTQNVVAQLVCKYLAKGVPWEYLTMTDIIGYVFRFKCFYMGTYEVYGTIVEMKLADRTPEPDLYFVHYDFMAQRDSSEAIQTNPYGVKEYIWFKDVSAKDGKEYETYNYQARLYGKTVWDESVRLGGAQFIPTVAMVFPT